MFLKPGLRCYYCCVVCTRAHVLTRMLACFTWPEQSPRRREKGWEGTSLVEFLLSEQCSIFPDQLFLACMFVL